MAAIREGRSQIRPASGGRRAARRCEPGAQGAGLDTESKLRAVGADDGGRGPRATVVKVLVTGADGFVGRWLIRRLLDDGREVYGAVRPSEPQREDGLTAHERAQVRWLPLEITDNESVRRCLDLPYDAVVHLAAIASGPAAPRGPCGAWGGDAAG